MPNLRLPVELTAGIDSLPGTIRIGSSAPDVTLVEFSDFNCPFCRKASVDLHEIVTSDSDLRIVFANNPILSPMSAQAAKVALAVFSLEGAPTAYELRRQLFAHRGQVDGLKALELAASLGIDRAAVEKEADGAKIGAALRAQMKLASSLGFVATPSYAVAGAGILGYPGPDAMAKVIASVRSCDRIAC